MIGLTLHHGNIVFDCTVREKILKSIDEGPFQMGTFRETLAEGEEDIWDNVKMLLEGSELTKDDSESQMYDDFEHFRQNKGESIHDYYVRFTKLINDMRNIKMTMPIMQLNSKFVNNMSPEWGRFVALVKLNRGLKESNFDQFSSTLLNLLFFFVFMDDEMISLSCGIKSQAGFENRLSILNKENYVPWSSRLLWYAKSRPNGKLIHNSIINGSHVRRMIREPSDPNREVLVNETFHVQTDDELTEKELKQIEADDQAIQTILLGLPEDICAAVDSCEIAQEIWLQQMMKGSNIGIQEKKANNLKFLNNLQPEWSRHVTIVHQTKDLHTTDYTQLYDFLKYNQKEVDDLKVERLVRNQDPLALMATSNNPYTFPVLHQDQPSFNQNYMQQPMPNPEDITDPTTAMNMALYLMAKAFKLNYSTPTNNNQRISSNPRNRQIAQPRNLNGYNNVQNVRNQVIQNAAQNLRIQNVGNQNGLIVVSGNANQNPNGNGHFARNYTVRPRRRDAAYLQTQLLIAQKEEAGI
nr:hypothetical protein [Tanacetum cinerariifolium]